MTIQARAQLVLRELAAVIEQVEAADAERLLTTIGEAKRVFVAGAGRSGLLMRGFAMRLMHLGLRVHIVGIETTPAIGPGDLLLCGSGSGSTPSLLAHAQRARQVGAKVALITATSDSLLGQFADLQFVVPAPTPKAATPYASQQPMASLFEQSMLVMLDVFAMLLMDRMGMSEQAMFTRHANLE
jgi:6-phospho-3-hexuloisomerase